MRKLILFLMAASLHAATVYVSSAGNDANTYVQAQSTSTPWLTLNHALTLANGLQCGDTIVIVANGSYVAGDATLPYIPGCSLTTTIQSSALAQFAPPGYRTNPANDAAAYGKLQLTGGIAIAATENHGSSAASYGMCGISSIAANTITLSGSWCNAHMFNLVNGSQVEFEINNTSNLTATIPPTPLTALTHYFVVNCSGGCGNSGSQFQVAATSGGSPITLTACDAFCMGGTAVTHPLEFTSGSATITTPDAFSGIANGTPLTLAAAGMQVFGTVPAPFALDTIYYVVNLSGRTFGLAATLGGSAITALNNGFGPLNLASIAPAHGWAFRGLEFKPTVGNSGISNMLQLGDSNFTSKIGASNHFEVDRCFFHNNPNDAVSITRAIANNGTYVYIHDSYAAGITGFVSSRSEGQAIQSDGSPGPSAYINNFLEAATQAVLNGGNGNGAGIANANQFIAGNYLYKPPIWKVISGSGAPSGPCWYDATDLEHIGGEWYRDTVGAQNYQCGPGLTYVATGTALPGSPVVKTGYEHKNAQNIILTGNLVKYVWAESQKGQPWTVHQSEDSSAGRANDHITITNNIALNIWRFMTGQSHCNLTTIGCPVLPTNHTFVNNLGVTSLSACGAGGNVGFGAGTCGQHLLMTIWDGWPSVGAFWNHNTIVTADSVNLSTYAFFANIDDGACNPVNGKLDYWVHKNSIVPYDFQGNCNNGGATFAAYFSHAYFRYNALVYHNGAINYSSPGATNTFLNFDTSSATNADVGYVNLAAGDYHLAATSRYSASCTGGCTPLQLSEDGSDLGADIDLVNMATSGAAAGTPASDVQAGLSILAGSTKAVFRYTAPNAGVCTATLYFSLVRIPMNVAPSLGTSFPDSAVGSIYDPSRRELLVTGLTANSSYWYKLVCPSANVTMVGNFATRATGSAVNWPVGTPGGGTVTYSVNPDMSGSSTTGSGTSQLIPVPSNTPVYWKQTTDTSPPSILLAP